MESGSAPAVTRPTRWEYLALTLTVARNTGKRPGFFTRNELMRSIEEESQVALAEAGAEGWELVSVVAMDMGAYGTGSNHLGAFFKRALPR